MSPDEIIADALDLRERSKEVLAEIIAIDEEYKPLATRRNKAIAEQTRLQKEMALLTRLFSEATGLDLKKTLREPTKAAIDQTHGALITAMCGDDGLPLDGWGVR